MTRCRVWRLACMAGGLVARAGTTRARGEGTDHHPLGFPFHWTSLLVGFRPVAYPTAVSQGQAPRPMGPRPHLREVYGSDRCRRQFHQQRKQVAA